MIPLRLIIVIFAILLITGCSDSSGGSNSNNTSETDEDMLVPRFVYVTAEGDSVTPNLYAYTISEDTGLPRSWTR